MTTTISTPSHHEITVVKDPHGQQWYVKEGGTDMFHKELRAHNLHHILALPAHGLNVPKPHRWSRHAVAFPFIQLQEKYPTWNRISTKALLTLEQMALITLFDSILGNDDRHGWNIGWDQDDVIWLFDHGEMPAYQYQKGRLATVELTDSRLIYAKGEQWNREQVRERTRQLAHKHGVRFDETMFGSSYR